MQRYANLPVKTFIESHLRPYSMNSQALNDLSMQYLLTRNFQTSVQAAETAVMLVSLIYDWGHYPSELMAFCNQWRHKAAFDELPNSEPVERLAQILASLLMEKPHPSTAKIYLRLLGGLRVASIQNQQVLYLVIDSVLVNLARHLQIDRLVHTFLIKCTLKISEGIKEYKYMIGTACTKLIFAMFSAQYLFTAPVKEMAKLYMDFLKLLVALGREVAMCPSGVPSDFSSEIHSSLMKSFVKVLVANLSISQDKHGQLRWINLEQPQCKVLLNDPLFLQQSYFQRPYYDLQTDSYQPLPATFPALEPRHDEFANVHISDAEAVEKIKSNSLSLLTMISRLNQELFLDKELAGFLYPKGLMEIDVSSIYQNQLFAPFRILNSQFADIVSREYSKTPCAIHLASLAKFSREKQLACHNYLNESYSKVLKAILSNGRGKVAYYAQMSLLGFFMTETNYEIKSQLMVAISTIHDQAYGRLNAHERAECTPAKKHIEIEHEFKLSDLTEMGIKTSLVFFLELFTTRVENMGRLFEGLHQCPVQSMLVHLPNKFVERVIHFLVIPVLAVCLHTHFDFCEQFDKFLATIFEARFSEFFLARINCLRELLVHNFGLSRTARQSCEQYGTKVKVLISAADELMEKFPHQMKQQYGFFANFALKELLPDKSLSAIQYLAPLMLSRIACLQRDMLSEYSNKTGLQSLTFEDLPRQKLPVTDLCDFQQYEEIPSTRSLLDDYQKMWPFIEKLFIECVMSAVNFGVKDKFEKNLISGILMIGPPMFELLDRTLYQKYRVSLETCFLDIFAKLRNKKHQLLLIEHLLSSPVLGMPELRKKLWAALFQMYKEKVLSVEIVFSNNMIIHGLRDNPELINTSQVIEIFRSSAGSLKSKNRKLINNCLKIFGNILTHYPASVVECILNMDVPNCFSDEIPQHPLANQKVLRGKEFLTLILEKFLGHKYSKYNVLTLSCLTHILKRYEGAPKDPLCRKLVEMATCSQVSILTEKFASSESFRFISLAISYFSKEICQSILTPCQLQNLANACWVQVIAQEGKTDFSHIEHLGWQETRYRAWLLFLKIVCNSSLDKKTALEIATKLVLENYKAFRVVMEFEKKYLTELRQDNELQERYLSKQKTVRQELTGRDFQGNKLLIEQVLYEIKKSSKSPQIASMITSGDVSWVLARFEEEHQLSISKPKQVTRLLQRSGDMTTRSNSPAARSDGGQPATH